MDKSVNNRTLKIKNPLVSIVLTSYNQPELLQKAFDSLINQSYKSIEIIIVDDHSTDQVSRKLIESFKNRFPEKVEIFFQIENVGIAKNKNTGFQLAKGDFITYLDGDDTYYEHKIAYELETLLKNTDADIVYSNFDIKNADGNIESIWASTKPAQGYIFESVMLNKFPDCHTHRFEMFKKNVLYELNFYDETLFAYEDLDLMIRYSFKYKVAYSDYIGSTYFKNPKSIVSKTDNFRLMQEQEKVYKKNMHLINDYGFKKKFNRYLKTFQANKLFYLKQLNLALIFKLFLKQPWEVIKFMKIINFVHKKR